MTPQSLGTDLFNAGAITTQNLVPAGLATPGSAVQLTLRDGACSLGVQVTGPYTGALSLQGTIDGTTWVTIGGNVFFNVNTGAISATIASAAVGIWQLECSNFRAIRITALAAVTGSANITITASASSSIVAIDNTTINADTEMPAAAAAADAAGNPTAPFILGAAMRFNGASWDRMRNNINTSTGDTGAKTATGNGATQTNYNASGAIIVFNIGTVSGTTPTCVFKVQGSTDGGTTWFDVPGAVTPSITASGTYVLAVYPSVTPAANAAVSFPIPRTWRVVWTIGGTTPSFTITNVQVAYVN